MIYNSIIETIGNTPLIRLNRIDKDIAGTLLAKVEYFNPGNSTKDRIAVKMIEDAEKAGLLKPGGTIVEGTSGNTGMGLALTATAKGYKCIFTLSDKQSKEKVDVLKAMGAKVVVCPSNVGHDDPRSYHSVAKKISSEIPNSFYPNQYDNLSNTDAHYTTTGPEIWSQTEGNVTHYAASVGTGGTMSGAAKYLKEQKKELVTVGIDAYGSILKKYKETNRVDPRESYPYMAEGFGDEVVCGNVNMDVIDHFVKVTDRDGTRMARQLAREEGFFIGWSSGAVVHGALEYARNHLREGDVMVMLLPDHGSRYLNKIYNDEWMQKNGFLGEGRLTAKDIILRRKKPSTLHTVSSKATLKEAAALLVQHRIERAPVVDRGEFVGYITASEILKKTIEKPGYGEEVVKDVMGPPLPFVSMHTTIDVLNARLTHDTDAALVGDMDENVYLITRHDLFYVMSL